MKKIFLFCVVAYSLNFYACGSYVGESADSRPYGENYKNKKDSTRWQPPTKSQMDSIYRSKYGEPISVPIRPDVGTLQELPNDSARDENRLNEAINFYKKNDFSMGDYSIGKISVTSPVYPKVQEYLNGIEQQKIDFRNGEIERENYYNSLFSKYKSRLTMLKKMQSLGFEQYDVGVHSMIGTGDALVTSYGLVEENNIISVDMWMTYTYEWRWSVSARTRNRIQY